MPSISRRQKLAECSFGLAAGWLVAACGAPPSADSIYQREDAAVSVTESELVVLNSTEFWPNGVVPVCFHLHVESGAPTAAETAEFNEVTARMRELIEEVYEQVPGATLDFTGWGACSDTDPNPGGRLRIRYAPSGTATWVATVGYLGTAVEAHMYASDGRYATQIAHDVATLHEIGHALGFPHEFGRSDFTTACSDTDGTEVEPETFLTVYDHESILNETYCGNWDLVLSDLDKLGLEIVYGDLTAKARGRDSISFAGGLALRADDALYTDWKLRGALSSAFDGLPSWGANGTASVGWSRAASTLGTSTSAVTVGFSDFRGRFHTGSVTVTASNSAHAAVVMAIL